MDPMDTPLDTPLSMIQTILTSEIHTIDKIQKHWKCNVVGMAEQISKKHRHKVIMSSKCYKLGCHDYLVLFGDLLSHSAFLMFLYLVTVVFDGINA